MFTFGVVFFFLASWVFVAAHGLSLVAARRLLTAVASLVAERWQGVQPQ